MSWIFQRQVQSEENQAVKIEKLEEMISLIEEELDKMHAAEEAGRRIEP